MAQQERGQHIRSFDLRLSVVKPIGAQWMICLYDYLKGKPTIFTHGFKQEGIFGLIAS